MFQIINQYGEPIARAHLFVYPGGGHGGSGMLDPKEILENGILYMLKKDRGI